MVIPMVPSHHVRLARSVRLVDAKRGSASGEILQNLRRDVSGFIDKAAAPSPNESGRLAREGWMLRWIGDALTRWGSAGMNARAADAALAGLLTNLHCEVLRESDTPGLLLLGVPADEKLRDAVVELLAPGLRGTMPELQSNTDKGVWLNWP